MRRGFNQSGFTLIELLLYVVLAGVMLLSISVFFSLSLSVRTKTESVVEVEQQGTLAMKYMTQIIRNASNITTPIIGATSSSLTIAVPVGTKSPTIFDAASGTLRIKEGNSNYVRLTDSRVSVTNLIFSNLTGGDAKGIIRIQFTLGRQNSSSTNEYQYIQNFFGTATLR
ncbi:MAG: prepilin-type N-terminal cleavage/methylation domain-containing protein [Patescibacteria group bacterium]